MLARVRCAAAVAVATALLGAGAARAATPSATEFSAGITAGAAPADITEGPDGNLWFTEPGIDKIGKITPAGAVTQFPLPSSGGHPQEIVAGPDGNLWFTEPGNDNMARFR